MVIVNFRFYSVLNNFLAPWLRQRGFDQRCAQDASVKHMIEALGVPHTEVELILVDGRPAGFGHRLVHGERVSVFPAFAEFELDDVPPLRPPLQGRPRFIADAHLGQLARQLRMLGFDALYRNDYSDAEVARIAAEEGRVVLTRDRDLLIRKEIVHGCYLHAIDGDEQVAEVISRYRLQQAVRAFSRCLTCNGELRSVPKAEVEDRVPPHSHAHYERFFECSDCAQVYWEGSHVQRMRVRMARMLGTRDE
ncbi:twitching motility protein PilT [Oxalobacteraceae bacterium OM1]|nr:twitching motility protein PilT [Oxalobacteraceae bacterium OM1]